RIAGTGIGVDRLFVGELLGKKVGDRVHKLRVKRPGQITNSPSRMMGTTSPLSVMPSTCIEACPSMQSMCIALAFRSPSSGCEETCALGPRHATGGGPNATWLAALRSKSAL